MFFKPIFFRGGIHPGEKEITSEKKIEKMPEVGTYRVTTLQHIGVPAAVMVKVGDHVKKYQKIGKAQVKFSAFIHSPCSGKITQIKKINIRGREAEEITIENDFSGEEFERKGLRNFTPEKLQELVDDLGIVGLGGATFPTHIKLEGKLKTIIINGVECEPYLNADNRVMIESTYEILDGIEILMTTFDMEEGIIGIEENKVVAIEKMEQAVKGYSRIRVQKLPTIYPQGAEKQLIKALLKKEIKSFPMEIEAVTLNVGTILAIYRGVTYGTPIVERIVTVSGEGIENPKNLSIPIGTPVKDVLNYVGVKEDIVDKIIACGPMMGREIGETEVTSKGMNGILALGKEKFPPKLPCIRCGRCVDVCPMGLLPLEYDRLAKKGKYHQMEKEFSLSSCIKCGNCEYICPSQVPLMEAIFLGLEKGRDRDD
ncbi:MULTISPECIES: electron transport complex subunit RsxC [Psychrilyobacter]|uniref:Ion-translocating oxidoreductase complex subunit C n=1 Tax=Psychrilyobacter piezotolerans TaxID=2293438 RepID=A0ABX9KH68_9FUSO|nr:MULTISPECIES: electron transport complex subunit RsxC [Psychrilyobacter]MCS5420472.1 electron transport complex subunit RsxC [Psychrilyobacter sp. S5]NDI78250.1 electron transport complex subunit RsxC [Psychrilyobacter piezotolerans]RDE61191.1 electron transport complex subunit RsxC [Psychrilyobacter sp. S5]REI40859.1 electron transport complex subunit RsxC [Psychrilyobacter piezotolerans]